MSRYNRGKCLDCQVEFYSRSNNAHCCPKCSEKRHIRNRPLTDDQIKAVREWLGVINVAEMARRLGISQHRVRVYFQLINVSPKLPRNGAARTLTPDQATGVLNRILLMDAHTIADEVGVPFSRLLRWCDLNGFKALSPEWIKRHDQAAVRRVEALLKPRAPKK